MLRRLLLGLALCGMAHAATPPRFELTAAPAWKGWTRPGRAGELEVRLGSDTATRVALELSGGRQTLRSDVDLQPGRVMRLHLPVGAADKLVLGATTADGTVERREIALAKSESPLLGVATAGAGTLRLEGFHAVALGADDLPRNASAYAGIDALVLDAPTLAALDQRQLGALLAHAAACGRIVIVDADERVRRLLDGAAGCAGGGLLHAATPAEAPALLQASLARNLPEALAPGGTGELLRPTPVVWNRVAVLLAVYVALAALAALFFSSLPALLLAPALAAVAALALLHGLTPSAQLLIWSEGHSGAQAARYQAWHQVQGLLRGGLQVPIPPALASSAQPCDSNATVQFDYDAAAGRASAAHLQTRLFRPVALCYAGSFPMARALAVEAAADGSQQLRNLGTQAWPAGVLIDAGRVHDLPALAPGARVALGAPSDRAAPDAVLRTALSRTPFDGRAALWALDLGGVAALPVGAQGWLLVSAPAR